MWSMPLLSVCNGESEFPALPERTGAARPRRALPDVAGLPVRDPAQSSHCQFAARRGRARSFRTQDGLCSHESVNWLEFGHRLSTRFSTSLPTSPICKAARTAQVPRSTRAVPPRGRVAELPGAGSANQVRGPSCTSRVPKAL